MPKIEYQVARTVSKLQILKRGLQAGASILACSGVVDDIEDVIGKIGKPCDSEGLQLQCEATSSAVG